MQGSFRKYALAAVLSLLALAMTPQVRAEANQVCIVTPLPGSPIFLLKNDPREPQKHNLAWIEAMIVDPGTILYSSTPRGLKKHAGFMYAAGTLKTKPEKWQDLVWDNLWTKDGS